MRNIHSGEGRAKDRLAQAVEAARSVEGERISSSTRQRLASRLAANEAAPGLLAPLFRPLSHSLAAVVAPVLVVGAVMLAINHEGIGGDSIGAAGQSATRIDAMKVEGRVVFNISNGGQEHTVVRSADPSRFDDSEAVRVNDAYVDRLDSGSKVTFYRIN